mgnify:CR=1 FL=1
MTDETKETKQASDCGETQEQSAPAMQQLVDQYGAGHIPTEEWEALNAWNSES